MDTYALDPRTTVLIGSITSGLMAIVLSLLARATPLPVAGLRIWVVGAWLVFMSLLLVGLRDWISPLASVTLGNSALILAYIVWLAGTRRHFGERVRWSPWLVAWAVAVAAVTWFVYGEQSFRARVVIVAGLCAFINAYHALVLLRHPHADRFGRSFGITLTICWLMVLAAVYGVRALHAVAFAQGNTGLLTQDAVQIVYTGSFTICNLMLVIGFATMASDHVRARIEEQAIRDPLTGTLNRQALVECLEREGSRGKRAGQPFQRGHARCRPFQEDQRWPWPPRGGSGADPPVPTHGRPGAAEGHRGPLRWRRVRDRDAGHGPARRLAGHPADPARRGAGR